MKHLRATVRADREDAPPIFALLAHSPSIEEGRVLEMMTALDDYKTFFVAIDGDVTALAAEASDIQAIETVETVHVGEDAGYVLVVIKPQGEPLVEAQHREPGIHGVIPRMPVVYRDGMMRARVIGDPAQLQEMFERDPVDMEVTIEEIGEFRGNIDTAWASLSARQLEALEIASDLGYYEQPRGATLKEIAAELGCAPQTASDHLQKAEGKVITAALDEFGPLQ